MVSSDWSNWWRERGDERLTLLLWAVWDPVGSVPLDEYESYAAPVASLLRKHHEADLELVAADPDVSDSTQRQRNKLVKPAAEEIASLLAKVRDERMNLPPDLDVDRRAADTFIDWYGWEMDALDS